MNNQNDRSSLPEVKKPGGREEAMEKVLASFSGYYNIDKNPDSALTAKGVTALAEFHLHDEQYFLVRSARLSEADVHEFVFFASVEELDAGKLEDLCETAWEEGMKKALPRANHRSSDVTLIILADRILPEAALAAKKWKRSKTYKFGFWGYSHFRLVVYDLDRHVAVRNPMGASHAGVISNIFKKS